MVGSLPVTAAPPTRRAVLVAGALAAGGLLPLAGCTSTAPSPDPQPPAADADPDAAVRADAVRRELTLLAAYDAALRAHPPQAALLRRLRAEHAEHLVALGAAPSPSPTPSSSRRSARAAVGRLPAAERAAASAHARAALGASRSLASLLAALAAAEASHVEALA